MVQTKGDPSLSHYCPASTAIHTAPSKCGESSINLLSEIGKCLQQDSPFNPSQTISRGATVDLYSWLAPCKWTLKTVTVHPPTRRTNPLF